MAAEAELRAMQSAMARLQLDLAEVRLSNSAPRNEICAPLVSGRDFVKDRLRLSAVQAQEAVQAAEAHLELVRRRSQLGAASATEVTEAQLRLAEHNRRLRRVVTELRIRDEFLTQRLSPEEATRRVQRGVIDIELAGAHEQLQVARDRVQLVRQRVAAGLMNEVELKRAELDVMEREVLLQRMMTEAQRMDRPEE